MSSEKDRLASLANSLWKSGIPNKDFFYLGGPMHHKPKFNYPRMKAIAELLRGNGYNIICPAELPEPEVMQRAEESPDGDYATMQRSWKDFMEDTITVLCMPHCVGAVFLPEWRESKGCRHEIDVLHALGKQVFEYGVESELGCPALIAMLPETPTWMSSPGAVEIAPDFREPIFVGEDQSLRDEGKPGLFS